MRSALLGFNFSRSPPRPPPRAGPLLGTSFPTSAFRFFLGRRFGGLCFVGQFLIHQFRLGIAIFERFLGQRRCRAAPEPSPMAALAGVGTGLFQRGVISRLYIRNVQ